MDSLCPTHSARIGLIMNLPIATEASYVYWLRHYAIALKAMPSSLPREQKLENFLKQDRNLSRLAASLVGEFQHFVIYQGVLAIKH